MPGVRLDVLIHCTIRTNIITLVQVPTYGIFSYVACIAENSLYLFIYLNVIKSGKKHQQSNIFDGKCLLVCKYVLCFTHCMIKSEGNDLNEKKDAGDLHTCQSSS